ncbi:MAG: RNA-dependent DNA polymerase [Symploca sp. SIO1B1]|nr:RNA-dependent DNA polymerase [Symploca sp. SIO1B1]
MKRYGNLWPQVTEFSNLLAAARQAQRGKRFRTEVLQFNYNLEQQLSQLQTELKTKTYQPGDYKTFEIKEPKPRLIAAAPYRDRIVHHALCNIITPICDRSFISDTYANRVGYGTHRALRRFTKFARSSKYILQGDISKYFFCIDHTILKSLLRRQFKCPETLWLLDTIIDSSPNLPPIIHYFPGDDLLTPLQRKRGIPIGNLTSQLFANIYLNGFDHLLKEQVKATKYLRYVDDFALFSDDRPFLEDAKLAIVEYLTSLRLKLHPHKTQLFATKQGANFLGFHILPDSIRVRTENLRRARRRLRKLELEYQQGKIPRQKVVQSLISWFAHLEHGDTWQLRQKIFSSLTWLRS